MAIFFNYCLLQCFPLSVQGGTQRLIQPKSLFVQVGILLRCDDVQMTLFNSKSRSGTCSDLSGLSSRCRIAGRAFVDGKNSQGLTG